MAKLIKKLRRDTDKIQKILQNQDNNPTMNEKQLKLADKGIILIKVGIKLLKKARLDNTTETK